MHARLLPARTLLSPLLRRRVAGADLTAYRHAVERLYHAAARTAGARVLVDTSKTPTHLDVLTSIPSLDVTILHLVRDPRAIAYSQRHRTRTMGPAPSAALYSAWHALTELRRARGAGYLRLRYEDFCARPRATVRTVLDRLDEPGDLSCFVGERELLLRPNHMFSGNQNRFRSGRVAVSEDDEWVWSLPRREAALVVALAWPLMARHGYPLRRPSRRAALARAARSAASESTIMRSTP